MLEFEPNLHGPAESFDFEASANSDGKKSFDKVFLTNGARRRCLSE